MQGGTYTYTGTQRSTTEIEKRKEGDRDRRARCIHKQKNTLIHKGADCTQVKPS